MLYATERERGEEPVRHERKERKEETISRFPFALHTILSPVPPAIGYSAPHCLGASHAFSALKKGGYALRKHLSREYRVIFHDTERILEVAPITSSTTNDK